MAVEIVMPKLSDTMEEGMILKWLKNVGDAITAGEPIAEVETDKADMEVEAAESGVLSEIKVGAGESAAVGAVIAVVDDHGAAAGRRAPANAAAAGDGRAAERSAAVATEADEDEGEPAAAAPPRRETAATERAGHEPSAAARAPGGASATAVDGRRSRDAASRPDVKTSPAARKIAAERGIDLRSVRGSGPDGRVVKEDVQGRRQAERPAHASHDGDREVDEAGAAARAARGTREAPPAGDDAGRATRPSAARAAAPAVAERQELSRMRQSIARRMTEAFRDVPHFYVRTTIDMTEAVRLKHALDEAELSGTPITYTHLVLKATALALRRHPRLNASYRDGAIEVKGDVNLGLAVAVDDGLIVPILRHVDELSLEEIAIEARRLAEQAKRGRFASEDLSGGTFTVSNMGMLDIEDFTAVINPPQAAILAVGAIKERPVVRAGAVVAARTMPVTLSCDHRIIDGVIGGRFLEELKRLLENPIVLVMRERFAG